ncbi:MAG: hypothetical protein ACYC5M_18480, partial [Anaerolineae bacterium]
VPPPESVAPATPRPQVVRSTAPPPTRDGDRDRSGGRFLRDLLLVLLGGLLGALLTLLIIALLSGSLRLASRSEVEALSRNLGTMQTNQELAFAEIDALRALSERQARRIEQLEPLIERVAELEVQVQAAESAVASLGERLDASEGRLDEIDQAVTTLQTQVEEVRSAVERFDTFFTALRDLLIDMQGLPETRADDTGTPDQSPPAPEEEPELVTPTATPLAPTPTATPSTGS